MLTRKPENSNVVLVRHLALMVYLSWCGWLLWGLSLGGLQLPWFFNAPFSAAALALGHYVVQRESDVFIERKQRAVWIAGAVFAVGLVPVNPAHSIPLAALVAQSVAHCLCTFALFFVRIKRTLPNTAPLLFVYSFSLLTAAWAPALLVALYDMAMSLGELEADFNAEAPADVEVILQAKSPAEAG